MRVERAIVGVFQLRTGDTGVRQATRVAEAGIALLLTANTGERGSGCCTVIQRAATANLL